MEQAYLGTLDEGDPLYAFLRAEVLRRELGLQVDRPIFDVHQLHPHALVMRYTERQSGADIACKFYGNKPPATRSAATPEYYRQMLHREYANLQRARALGLDQPPYRVVRPLACGEQLNYVLAEEYVEGTKLDASIKLAFQHGDHLQLYGRLDAMAGFLLELHHRTATGRPVARQPALEYFDKVLWQLAEKRVIGAEQRGRLARLRDAWAVAPQLSCGEETWIHGDATPVNFVFAGDQGAGRHEVIAIDLERMRPGDPMADVGCVAAELLHTSCLLTGDLASGEPYIQHLYARYAERLGGQAGAGGATFAHMTARGRFWMGLMELRICRNSWLDLEYRRRLADEAERCLSL